MSSEGESQIGGYRLLNLMYQGQTSQVWEVVETISGRHFALKILLPEATRQEQHRNFLYHEAEVGLKLQHPKVIRFLKLVRHKDNPYAIIEFFPSVNLGLRLKRRNELVREYAHMILEQAATGLAYINDKGWVHRDIKPDNIIVNSAAEVKVIDFALAKRVSKGGFFDRLFRRRTKAQGTRSYMPPEQIRNEPLDERADIYSFAATMYETLTGRPPFIGNSPADLLNKQLYEKPVSPQAYNAEITDDCAKLIVRMLAKDKTERPRNFSEFLLAFHNMPCFKGEKLQRTRK